MFARVMTAMTGQVTVEHEDDKRPPEASPLCDQLYRLARRIADHRVIAGVHFPIDSASGYVLARALSDYFVARCRTTPSDLKKTTFDGTKYRPAADIDPRRTFEKHVDSANATMSTADGPPGRWEEKASFAVAVSPLLNEMWKAAQRELNAQGFNV